MSESIAHASHDADPTTVPSRTSGGPSAFNQLTFYALILLCFLPLLSLHFRQLWLYEHYQYFPILLLGFPVVIDRIRGTKSQRLPVQEFWQWPLIIGGLVLLALAVLSWSPNLAAVAFVVTCGGVLWHFYRNGQIGRFFSCWFVLFFLIKLPLNIDVDLIFWLQGITSRLASRLVDVVGINHFLAGHSIKIADASFAVEEACSGIQSLFSLMAMTALVLALFRRTLAHSVLLMLVAVFWACMINTIRVATVVVAYESLGIDLTQDRPHEILGIVLFVAAIGLVVCSDRLLLFFFADDTIDGDDDEIEHFKSLNEEQIVDDESTAMATPSELTASAHDRSESPAASRDRLRLAVLVSFVVLAVLQLGILLLTSRGLQSINPDDPRLANVFTESTLPSTFGKWSRKDFRTESRSLTNYQGRNSAQWVFESELGEVVIGVDYPFLGWHELTGCYIAEGCTLDAREVLPSDNAIQAIITAPSGAKGHLIFSEFMTDGQPLLPLGNDAGTLAYWRSRLQTAFIRQYASFQPDVGSFQVQLIHYYERPTSDATEAELSEFHRSMTERIVDVVKEATSSND